MMQWYLIEEYAIMLSELIVMTIITLFNGLGYLCYTCLPYILGQKGEH